MGEEKDKESLIEELNRRYDVGERARRLDMFAAAALIEVFRK